MMLKINHVVFLKQRIRVFPEVLPLQFAADCFTIRGAQRDAVISFHANGFRGTVRSTRFISQVNYHG
ncbi:hypothetical protein Enr10x_05130 [Gimesia panareensis]|uniref:Uncharacterized protein n=1 Tax=Gimesia panareensis TaxID=2527978 RepID=A0A517Q0P9_9PLAN|nr:hypothetical protein Enr10x_05130 [Gimesia panareensis]